jgi:heme oxygenase
MLSRLTVETAVHHATADADRSSLLEAPSVESYRHYLATIYGFEARLEAPFVQTPGFTIKFLQERLKAGRLAADLLALGLGPAEYALLARAFAIARFESVAPALGWMYVVERSTLQHPAILERLQPILPEQLNAAAYLTSYDGTTADRWRELGEVLDQTAYTSEVGDRIVAAAHEAFARQHQWFVTARSAPSIVVERVSAQSTRID